ncbi:MAG TPA: transglycosylase SLT domain-containing protein [Candidatus Krumholzibacteria bacterium]|nr:transglycosylase SLT domain-containing protein [Candidatus Krumholzibacteria bacterium]
MAISVGSTGTALSETASLGAEQARLRSLQERADVTPETRAGLEKAAKEFEAVFLNQLMKAMRSTVPENELFNSQGATKFYQQMYDQEMAKALSGTGSGMGVADLIIRQFERNVASPDQPAGAAATVPAARPDAPIPAAEAARTTPSVPADPAPAGEMLGPPAPSPLDRGPVQGPPAPAPEAVAARYRKLDPTAGANPAMARLRLMAGTESTASADTLARIEPHLEAASQRHDVPPALLLAVVMEESGGDPQARSGKGATGLMQLMPATAAELGVEDALDPAQNLDGGAAYLSRMLERFDGRVDLALAAYNAGPGNVDKAGGRIPAFRETQGYVRKVLDRYDRLGGGTDLAIRD